MKLALAQLNVTPRNIVENTQKIVDAWKEAEENGADFVVTPEQSIAGYPLEDMAKNPDVLAASKEALDKLVEFSAGMNSAILVGIPEQDAQGNVYNSMYLVDQGKIVAKRRKHDLPNYDVFDEKRIYTMGDLPDVVEWRGIKLGLPICEDIWHKDVCNHLKAQGAEVLISANASPYYVGKQHDRINDVLKKRTAETGLPMVYVNQVGGIDEIVFDGHSCVMNAGGQIVSQSRGFEEALDYVDLASDDASDDISMYFENGVVHDLDDELEEIWKATVLGLRDYINKVGYKGVLLGMSGGIDSAVVAALAVDAFGAENVNLFKLPSEYSSDHSITDSDDAAVMLGCNSISEIAINETVAPFRQSVSAHFKKNANQASLDLADENMQSRIRGLYLMTISNANDWMLLSTGNKSEMAVGYCTIYGDMNGGFNPLKDISKMTVYALADWRNKNFPRGMLGPNGPMVPQNIIDKKPSAELRPGQVDEESLPPYPVLDEILRRYVEAEESIEQIVTETGYDEEIVRDMIHKTDRAEFKRRQACPGVKISPRSFGKGRRVPIVGATIPNMRKSVKDMKL
jgi:NAD+ synthase